MLSTVLTLPLRSDSVGVEFCAESLDGPADRPSISVFGEVFAALRGPIEMVACLGRLAERVMSGRHVEVQRRIEPRDPERGVVLPSSVVDQ